MKGLGNSKMVCAGCGVPVGTPKEQKMFRFDNGLPDQQIYALTRCNYCRVLLLLKWFVN